MMDQNVQAIQRDKLGYFKRLRISLHEARMAFRQGGIKGILKTYGWKAFAIFFVFYLVRDVILYILIPYLVARHFM